MTVCRWLSFASMHFQVPWLVFEGVKSLYLFKPWFWQKVWWNLRPQNKKTSPILFNYIPASKSSTSKGLTPQRKTHPICVWDQLETSKQQTHPAAQTSCAFFLSFILPTPGRTFRSLRWDLLFTRMFRLSSLGGRVRIEIGPWFRSWFHLVGPALESWSQKDLLWLLDFFVITHTLIQSIYQVLKCMIFYQVLKCYSDCWVLTPLKKKQTFTPYLFCLTFVFRLSFTHESSQVVILWNQLTDETRPHAASLSWPWRGDEKSWCVWWFQSTKILAVVLFFAGVCFCEGKNTCVLCCVCVWWGF